MLDNKMLTNIVHRNKDMVSFTIPSEWLRLELKYAIERGIIRIGWGNGYVGVPKGNLLYGAHYDYIRVDVHGGLTYSAEIVIDEKKYWAFGFDTSHAWDNEEKCNEVYVLNEVENLYLQLSNYKLSWKCKAIYLSWKRRILKKLKACFYYRKLISKL